MVDWAAIDRILYRKQQEKMEIWSEEHAEELGMRDEDGNETGLSDPD